MPHQKIEPGAGSVVQSVGQDFSISFSLQLLISWPTPSRCLNLTNGLPGDHSEVAGTLLFPGLVEAFGLNSVWLTKKIPQETRPYFPFVKTILQHIRRLSQEPVQWSRAWGRIFLFPFHCSF
jgi:hypothetical protein